MILVTFVLVFVINIGVLKLYWESIEQDWQISMETMADTASMEDMLEDWTLHQQSFYVLAFADMLVCVAVWILVSLLFTGGLARQIMEPLNVLGQGAKRIRENELTEAIYNKGDEEFEEIGMQIYQCRFIHFWKNMTSRENNHSVHYPRWKWIFQNDSDYFGITAKCNRGF